MTLTRAHALASVLAVTTVHGWASAAPEGPARYTSRRVPEPGSVYREYVVMMGGNAPWRITDPDAGHKGAQKALPNPVLRMEVGDLVGARRAELIIDRWGGHPGTSGKRVRFNGQPWIEVPEVGTVPEGKDPRCFMSQDNPVVEVPLAHLRPGVNTLEGTAGDQVCYAFKWGQWGWYGALLRVYYDPERPHPVGRIVSPRAGARFGDFPRVMVQARGPRPVVRVDVVASYEGYDENGDGVYDDWHESYHYGQIGHHIGTDLAAPFALTWDTRWVPDQAPGQVKLVARLQDADGLWFVTPLVEDLTLSRRGSSVKLYPSQEVPERFWVRDKRGRLASTVTIPEADGLVRAREAALHLRTWNGMREPFTLGQHQAPIRGADHAYAYTIRPVPVTALSAGKSAIAFQSDDHHHGAEILWPGPALTVRYGKPPQPPTSKTDEAAWFFPEAPYRVLVEVGADGVARSNRPLEVPLDFSALLRRAGARGPFDETSLRVVTLDLQHPEVAHRVPESWQLDRSPDFDPAGRARGTLVVSDGLPGPDKPRRLHVYFGPAGRPYARLRFPSRVSVTDGVEFQGQESFRIKADGATYLYHKEGGGFASLQDAQSREWIGYKPGGRSAGESRGIPNLGAVGHPGYTGEKGSRSRLVAEGPLKATIASESNDGKWAWTWEIFPTFARLEISKAAAPYWFLYEGTPGGKLDVDQDYYVLSNGERRPVSEMWKGELPGPEWAYFGDPATGTALFVAKHADDQAEDQFYQLEGNMTVFGFGRQHRCCDKYLTGPGTFTVGLIPATDPEAAREAIISASRPLAVKVSKPERAPGLR